MEAGGLGVRRVDKKDIRRIAKATGGQVTASFSSPLPASEGHDL